jgi:hypothetical protein
MEQGLVGLDGGRFDQLTHVRPLFASVAHQWVTGESVSIAQPPLQTFRRPL